MYCYRGGGGGKHCKECCCTSCCVECKDRGERVREREERFMVVLLASACHGGGGERLCVFLRIFEGSC
jgi:hypothetical protein